MNKILATMILSLLVFILTAPVAGQVDGESKSAEDVQKEEAEREVRRQERRARWQRYREASPDDRQKMRTERMVDMAVRTYELDDQQKEQVRGEIGTIRREYREKLGPRAEEYDRLRVEMYEFWQKRSEGSNDSGTNRWNRWRELREDPEFARIRKRMREIDQEVPFDWQASMKRVEALLPEEQAAKGRKRIEERTSGWRRRRADREKERAEAAAKQLESVAAANQQGDAADVEEVVKKAEERLKTANLPDDVRRRLEKTIAETKEQLAENRRPAPLHPWERYAREFAEKHSLTPAQRSAAESILREVQRKASQLNQTNASKRAAAEKLEDDAARRSRLAELDKPLEQLYEQLQDRLDLLLTAAQRRAAAKSDKKRDS